MEKENKDALAKLSQNVYVESVSELKDGIAVKGYDFNKGLDYEALFKTFIHSGFQATAVGQAIDVVNSMINWRLSDEPIAEDETEEYKDQVKRENTHCTIFLGYTSN